VCRIVLKCFALALVSRPPLLCSPYTCFSFTGMQMPLSPGAVSTLADLRLVLVEVPVEGSLGCRRSENWCCGLASWVECAISTLRRQLQLASRAHQLFLLAPSGFLLATLFTLSICCSFSSYDSHATVTAVLCFQLSPMTCWQSTSGVFLPSRVGLQLHRV